MTEKQDSWRDVMSKSGALGQKLRGHLGRDDAPEEAQDPTASAATQAGTGTGTGAAQQPGAHTADGDSTSDGASDSTDAGRTDAAKAAVGDLSHKLQDKFDSTKKAAKDPDVRNDVKDLGVALKGALMGTINKVTTEVGETVKKVRGESDTDTETAPGPQSSTSDTTTTPPPTPPSSPRGTTSGGGTGSTGSTGSGPTDRPGTGGPGTSGGSTN